MARAAACTGGLSGSAASRIDNRVELDDIEILAQFIVQVAREFLAFIFVHVRVLLRQTLVFRQRVGKFPFGGSAQVEFPRGLEIAAR